MQKTRETGFVVAACALALVAGCGDDGGATSETGTVQVFVEPEDTIPEGLDPGTGEENIADGWRVTYERFLVTVGNVRAARSDAEETLGDPSVFVLDLKNAPATRYVIAEFEGVSAVRWDRFGFDLPNAREGVKALPPTTDADVALMVEGGYSVFFEGVIEKEGGESCPPPGDACVPAERVRFSWGLSAGTSFDDCATEDGLTGFNVPTSGTIAVKPTIHGDHWFFNNITAGVELTERYAQYIADSDRDGDGETTIEELKRVNAADVFGAEYNLAGALGGPIETAYDYVVAQARTLGDFQGDGECPTREVLP
ncbi:hypothetical protein SOCEGT47_062890 [Sorangium cellulosum]|uniref:Uncharacterized protein n=1 Tax=Sorangium cellulosum TaxID=56 RepID=A0A4P2Q8B2_SORCE|nr:hypothetical protein [Sorangium cellulosum]AUX25740.1 hypothetical protein SOCEGT47_062890 [Sorangium cellulosum]